MGTESQLEAQHTAHADKIRWAIGGLAFTGIVALAYVAIKDHLPELGHDFLKGFDLTFNTHFVTPDTVVHVPHTEIPAPAVAPTVEAHPVLTEAPKAPVAPAHEVTTPAGEHVPEGNFDVTKYPDLQVSDVHPDKVYLNRGGHWYVYDRLMSGTQPTAYFDANHPLMITDCDAGKLHLHPLCEDKPVPPPHHDTKPVHHDTKPVYHDPKPVPKPEPVVVSPPVEQPAPTPVPAPAPAPHNPLCHDDWQVTTEPGKVVIENVTYDNVRVFHAPSGMTEEDALAELQRIAEQTDNPNLKGTWLLYTDATGPDGTCDGHPEKIECVTFKVDGDGQVTMSSHHKFLGYTGSGSVRDYDKMSTEDQKRVLAS